MTTASHDDAPDPSALGLRGRLKFLAKDSVLYGGAAALSRAFSLITFPILASHFSVAEYGLIDFLTTIASLAAVTIIFGQDSAVARFFYEHKEHPARREIISQSLTLQLGIAAACLVPIWYLAPHFLTSLSTTSDSKSIVSLIVVSLPFRVLGNFSQNLLKWTFARRQFLILSLGSVVLNSSLLMLGIAVFRVGIVGVIGIMTATSVALGLLGLYFVRSWIKVPNGFVHLRELLRFAVPFGVLGTLSLFVPTMERGLVASYLGSEELGLYAVATKMAMLVALFVGAFQTAWGPFSLAIHKEPDAGVTYNWVLKSFAVGMSVMVLLVSAVSVPTITLLASNDYAAASVAVFPLAMGAAIQATSWICEIGILISKKTHLSLYSYAVFAAVTLGLILILTPLWGLVGTASGVMLGHLVKAAVASWFAQRAYPLPWQYGHLVRLTTGVMISGFSATWLQTYHYPIWTVLGCYLTGGAWALWIGWRRFLSSEERGRLWKVVIRLFRWPR